MLRPGACHVGMTNIEAIANGVVAKSIGRDTGFFKHLMQYHRRDSSHHSKGQREITEASYVANYQVADSYIYTIKYKWLSHCIR